jgi:hypothetical protein
MGPFLVNKILISLGTSFNKNEPALTQAIFDMDILAENDAGP